MSNKRLNLLAAVFMVLASSLAMAAGNPSNGKGVASPSASRSAAEIFRPNLDPIERYALDFLIAQTRGRKFEQSPQKPYEDWITITAEGRTFAKSLEGKLPHVRSAAINNEFDRRFESTVKRLSEAANTQPICEITPFWQMDLDTRSNRYEFLPVREALYGSEQGAGNMVHDGVLLNSIRPDQLGDKAIAQLIKLYGNEPRFTDHYLPPMEPRGGKLVYTQTRPFLKYCYRLTGAWEAQPTRPNMAPPKVLDRPLQLIHPQSFAVLATIPTEAFK